MGSARPRILLLAADMACEPDLVRFLGHPSSGLEVVRRCLDLADLLAHAETHAVDLILLSGGAAGCDAGVVQALAGRACVVGLADTAAARDALHGMGVAAVADLGVDSAIPRCVLGAVEQAMAGSATGAPTPVAAGSATTDGTPTGRIVTVWGPPGAPGRSTVAAGLAVAAAGLGCSVVLVDADVDAPAQAFLHDVRARHGGLLAACHEVEDGTADERTPARHLRPLQPAGLSLLPGLADPCHRSELRPAAVRTVLRAAAADADLVIVDVAADLRAPVSGRDLGWMPHPSGVARACVAQSEVVLAVMRAQPLGVHRFATAWAMLREAVEPSGAALQVVANAVGEPEAGPRPADQIAKILDTLAPGVARTHVGRVVPAGPGTLAPAVADLAADLVGRRPPRSRGPGPARRWRRATMG